MKAPIQYAAYYIVWKTTLGLYVNQPKIGTRKNYYELHLTPINARQRQKIHLKESVLTSLQGKAKTIADASSRVKILVKSKSCPFIDKVKITHNIPNNR